MKINCNLLTTTCFWLEIVGFPMYEDLHFSISTVCALVLRRNGACEWPLVVPDKINKSTDRLTSQVPYGHEIWAVTY